MGIGDPAQSGFLILKPGTWRIYINFTASVGANNTEFLIRLNIQGVPGTPVEFSAKSAGDNVSGSVERYGSVTQADLDAGDVWFLYEVASNGGTENITWGACAIGLNRIGVSNG